MAQNDITPRLTVGRDTPTYRYLVWRWMMPAVSVLPCLTTPARTARHAVAVLLGGREPGLHDGYVEMARVTTAQDVTFDRARQDELWSWLRDQGLTSGRARHDGREPQAG